MVFVVVQTLSLVRYVTLYFRDWRGAASLGHRKRVATTVLMCVCVCVCGGGGGGGAGGWAPPLDPPLVKGNVL